MVRQSLRQLHANRKKACRSRSKSKACRSLSRNKQGVLVSTKKSRAAKSPRSPLATFTRAAKEMGYLQRGTEFRRLPRKGTEAHKAIVRRAHALRSRSAHSSGGRAHRSRSRRHRRGTH